TLNLRINARRGRTSGRRNIKPNAPAIPSTSPANRHRHAVGAAGTGLPTAAHAALTAALTSTGSYISRMWSDQGEMTTCAFVMERNRAGRLKVNSSNKPANKNSGGPYSPNLAGNP